MMKNGESIRWESGFIDGGPGWKVGGGFFVEFWGQLELIVELGDMDHIIRTYGRMLVRCRLFFVWLKRHL